MNRTTIALALAMLSATVSANTLCLAGEKVVFSCSTKRDKLASLCLDEHGLSYRFGTNRQVELSIRDPGPSQPLAFRYYHYFRYQVDRTSIEVETPQALYEIFANFEDGPGPHAGVRATDKQTHRTAVVACVPGKEFARWRHIEGKIACSEEALNVCTPAPAR